MKGMNFENTPNKRKEDTRPYDYELNPPQGEDPLVVGTERYGNYRQDDDMVSDDVLEDQRYGEEPPNFVPIEDVPDPDSHKAFEGINTMENDENNNIIEDGRGEEEFDSSRVFVNGFPLSDIMEGKVPEEDLPQGSGLPYGEKMSVNREKVVRDFADEERKE